MDHCSAINEQLRWREVRHDIAQGDEQGHGREAVVRQWPAVIPRNRGSGRCTASQARVTTGGQQERKRHADMIHTGNKG